MSKTNFPSITAPQPTLESVMNTVLELKAAVDMLTGQQETNDAALLRSDMTDLARRNLPLSTGAVVRFEQTSWTPVLTTTGTNFTSVTYDARTYGYYFRIGNCVLFRGALVTDAVTVGSASGTVIVSGLPYNNVANVTGGGETYGSVTIGYAALWAGEEPISGLVVPDSKYIQLYYRATVDGDSTATAVADVATGANTNLIYFSGFYQAVAA